MKLRRTALIAVGIAAVLVLGAVPPVDDASGATTLGDESTQNLPTSRPNLKHAVNLWLSDVVQMWWGSDAPLRYLGALDLTHDGIVDLVLAQDGDLFSPPGNGDGSFGIESRFTPFFSATDQDGHAVRGLAFPRSHLLTDIDGDGDEDLVVGGRFSDPGVYDTLSARLVVFEHLNRTPGCFATEPIWIELSEAVDWLKAVPQEDGGMTIIGVAEDYAEDHYVTRIYAVSCSAEFMFGEPKLIFESEGKPFHVGDFDGDGHVDVGMIRHPREIHIAYGSSDHVFSDQSVFETQEDRIRRATAGDVNGDGVLDLVFLTSRGVVVAVSIAGGFRGSLPIPIDAEYIYLSDMDADGWIDLLAHDRRDLWILPGDGTGRFDPSSGSAFALPANCHKLHPVDLNGDGRMDLIGDASPVVVTLINGGLPHGETWIPYDGSSPLGVADVDGDSAVDIVVERVDGIDVLWNDGSGAFVRSEWVSSLTELRLELEEEIAEELLPIALEQADDGVLYLLGQRGGAPCPGVNFLAKCDRGELYAVSPTGEVVGAWELGPDIVGQLSSGDFDGNGTSDVAVSSTETLYVLWNGEEVRSYAWRREGGGAVVSGDYDGDGEDELAVVYSDGELKLLLVKPTYGRRKLLQTLLWFDGIPLSLTSADIDGDGISDPVAVVARVGGEQEEDGYITLFMEGVDLVSYASDKGEATIVPMTAFPEGSMPWPLTGLVVADVTGDGIADAVCTAIDGNGVIVMEGQGDATFETHRSLPIAVGPLLAADLDGNGVDEVISATLGVDPALWIQWNGGRR
jgi:FG-GAP-like repeat